ncbi:dynein axonemal assembly factor 4 [Diretmus argenteus]
MPLIVNDYSWRQTVSTVYINLPLKGATAREVDVLLTDEYLKVHFPPFLFEAFLFAPINDDKSTTRIGNGAAVITLPKRTSEMWEQLMIIGDKDKRKEIRESALLKYEEKMAAQGKAKAAKKQKERKYALETMMKLEQEERDSIQKMKDDEREKATAQLEAWKLKQKQIAEEESCRKPQSQRTHPDTSEAKKMPTIRSGAGNVQRGKRGLNEAKSKKKQVDLPAPRPFGSIQVHFTPRVFPTALRESRVPEEEEWLRKEAEARRAINAALEELKDLKEEERNPDWLREKGNKCFATGDYLGAVNAYSLAIELNRKIPALYSNRAACHLKLRNLHKAIEDSSQALDMLTPPVAANASARTRAHVRRGSAFCELQLYAEGLQDYQAALRMDPQNEALQEDTRRIREMIQGGASNPDED